MNRASRLCPIILLCLTFLGSACALKEGRWFATQAAGQAELLFAARSAKRIRQNPDTDPDVRMRLLLVEAAKQFAKNDLGLNVSQQYRSATFLEGPAVVYVVSAAPYDSLKAHTWKYPILGELPYRGYFSLEEAEAQADEMEAQGFDVDVRPVSTYSLLGIVPDPIVSSMLFSRDELRIVETVIHELSHSTVFASNQGAFNEGLATFIGREGRRRFVEKHYGKESAIYRVMSQKDRDVALYVQAMNALAFDLRVLLARKDSFDEPTLRKRKDDIFRSHLLHFENEIVPVIQTYSLRGARLPTNNAELSSFGIYTLEQQLYQRAFLSCGEAFPCFLALLESVADEDDPEGALEEKVRARTKTERILP